MVKHGRVALDGTKVRANASKHKAMRYGRMLVAKRSLRAKVRKIFEEARETDLAEDAEYGHGQPPKDLPEELKLHRDRLAKIRAAKRASEEEAARPASAPASDSSTNREDSLMDGGSPPL
jgi:hypothetical protein